MGISDASTDGTDELVKQFDSPRVRLFRQNERMVNRRG